MEIEWKEVDRKWEKLEIDQVVDECTMGQYITYLRNQPSDVRLYCESILKPPFIKAQPIPSDWQSIDPEYFVFGLNRKYINEYHDKKLESCVARVQYRGDVEVEYVAGSKQVIVRRVGDMLDKSQSGRVYDKYTVVFDSVIDCTDEGELIVMEMAQKVCFCYTHDMQIRQPVKIISEIIKQEITVDPFDYGVPCAPNYFHTIKHMIKNPITTIDKDVVNVLEFDLSLERLIYLYNKLIPLKDYLKFMDIPRQWMNCPMKWGAVGGYLVDGNYRLPRPIIGGVYYGAVGGKAVRIFRDVIMYDVEKQCHPELPSTLSPEIAKKIYSYYPKIEYGDVFNWAGGNRMYSDAWSNTWGIEHVSKLLSMAAQGAVVKINVSFDILLKSLDNISYSTLYILNFGRPATTEIFITSIFRGVDDDYVYVITPTTHRSVLRRIMRFKLVTCCRYIATLCVRGRTDINLGRPFKIENWMWPLVCMPSISRRSVQQVKVLSFYEYGVINNDVDMRRIDVVHFRECLKGVGYNKCKDDWSRFDHNPSSARSKYKDYDYVV